MKVFKHIRNNWILIWLVIVIISFSTLASYAAYTGTTTAKKVISLESRDSILFSSRYMYTTGTEMQPVLFNYTDGTTPNTPIVVVDVCNYDVSGNVYDKDFTFKIKARLVHRNGDDITASEWAALESSSAIPTGYTIAYKSHSDTTGALSSSYTSTVLTLTNVDQYLSSAQVYSCPGSDKTRYLFETKYPITDITNATSAYGIRIEAEIVENYSDIQSIWGMLRVMKGGSSTESTWEGKFMDDTSDDKKPADYDGINFQLSGNAEGIVKLTYRSDYIELDKDDYAAMTITDTDTSVTNYKTLTISVDAEVKSVYDLKFYWKKAPDSALAFNDSFIKAEFETSSNTTGEGGE